MHTHKHVKVGQGAPLLPSVVKIIRSIRVRRQTLYKKYYDIHYSAEIFV